MRRARPRPSAARSRELTRILACCIALTATAISVAPRPAAAETCPNERLRAESGSARLPDCRAYELVTPSSKFGQSVEAPAVPTAVSADGHVLYGVSSLGTFGDASNGLPGRFLATRTSSGWVSTSVGLPASSTPTIKDSGFPQGASADFSTLLYETETGIDPGDQNGVADVYARSRDGSFTWVSQHDTIATSPVRSSYVGNSADANHVLFQTMQALTASDSAQVAGFALYDRVGSETTLVGVRSDGSLTSTCGAVLGNSSGGFTFDANGENQVSSDGSRIFFESPDPAAGGAPSCSSAHGGSQPVQLYLRQDAKSTTEISLSQRAGSAGAPAPDGATFQGASMDGSRVFFTSPDQLTNDGTAASGGLYQYDVRTGGLTFLGSGTPLRSLRGEPQISSDGTRVYFKGNVPGTGPDNSRTGGSLYLWDAGRLSYISPAPARSAGEGNVVPEAQASADGSTLAFTSAQNATGFDSKGHYELFVYKASDGSLVCVSCNASGAPPAGSPQLTVGFATVPSHALSSEGSRVFFSSPDPLVPGATNGQRNVYEYEHGSLYLLSDGNGSGASFLVGVSSDATDVIISTGDSFTPQDENNGDVDLYDARVDGGFPAPVVPVRCEGDACQAPPSRAPLFASPVSATFPAVGNALPPPLMAAGTPPTRAQRLAKALASCRREPKRRRRACRTQAAKRYAARRARSPARAHGRTK